MIFLSYGGKRLDKLLNELTSKDNLLLAEQLDVWTMAIYSLRILRNYRSRAAEHVVGREQTAADGDRL